MIDPSAIPYPDLLGERSLIQRATEDQHRAPASTPDSAGRAIRRVGEELEASRTGGIPLWGSQPLRLWHSTHDCGELFACSGDRLRTLRSLVGLVEAGFCK